MDVPVKGNVRNQAIDCCKLVASIFVVFIHVPFPGNFGMALRAMGRFAVPIFFAVSGYYSYRIGESKLKKRLLHTLWLNVLASGVMLLWDCLDAWIGGVYLPSYLRQRLFLTAETLADWVVLQINPFGGHLWYLTAILLCYVTLWVYHRFFGEEEINYTPLYILSVGLLLFNIAMGELTRGVDLQVSNKLVRNFWFSGLPMFTMGIFIRQYHTRLMTNFCLNGWKLAALVLLGEILSVLQHFGMGSGEFPVGMLLTVPALMLLVTAYPTITRNPHLGKVISLFSDTATAVYIVHLIFQSAYDCHLAPYLDWLISDRSVMDTLFTAVASLVSCMAFTILVRIVKTLRNRI